MSGAADLSFCLLVPPFLAPPPPVPAINRACVSVSAGVVHGNSECAGGGSGGGENGGGGSGAGSRGDIGSCAGVSCASSSSGCDGGGSDACGESCGRRDPGAPLLVVKSGDGH